MKRIALLIAASLAVGGSAFAGTKPSVDAATHDALQSQLDQTARRLDQHLPPPTECMTLDKLKGLIKGSRITPLNIGQFNFSLGAYDATTPTHTPLPDADHAVILSAGKDKNILVWMKGDCALEVPPMPLAPEFAAHLRAIHPTVGETSDAPDTSSDLHL